MAKRGRPHTRTWVGPHQELRTHHHFRTRTTSNRITASRATTSRETTTIVSLQGRTTLSDLQQSPTLAATRWATRLPPVPRRRTRRLPVPQVPQASLPRPHASPTMVDSPLHHDRSVSRQKLQASISAVSKKFLFFETLVTPNLEDEILLRGESVTSRNFYRML